MKRKIYTKHGWVSLNVENLGSDRLYVVLPRKRPPLNKEKKFRKKFPDGVVLISRHNEKRPEGCIYQIYRDGIYAAIRSRSRIKKQYGAVEGDGEKRELVLNINSARLYLEKLLRYCQLSGQEQLDAQVCLAKLAESLRRARNLFKEQARDYIELSSEPEDSLGRVNPSVMCNQLTTGMENLNFRLLEIPGISKFIDRDQVMLMRERDNHLFLCKQLYYLFCEILQRPVMREPRKYLGEEFPKLVPWIEKRIQDAEAMKVAPFTKNRRHVIRDLKEALEFAERGDYARVAVNFRRVRNSFRFKEVQFNLEEIILKITLMLSDLKANPSDKNKDWIAGRALDIGGNISDLRSRLLCILDDRGFQFMPKGGLLDRLDTAERQLFALEIEKANDTLKLASRLI